MLPQATLDKRATSAVVGLQALQGRVGALVGALRKCAGTVASSAGTGGCVEEVWMRVWLVWMWGCCGCGYGCTWVCMKVVFGIDHALWCWGANALACLWCVRPLICTLTTAYWLALAAAVFMTLCPTYEAKVFTQAVKNHSPHWLRRIGHFDIEHRKTSVPADKEAKSEK